MSAHPVRPDPAPAPPPPASARRLRRVRGLARILDTAVRVPGTNIRFGLDALVGLIPGVGDVAGGVASGWVILEAARAGAPATVLVRMLGNVLVEVVLGAAPVLGDLFDVAWKANVRNAGLLEEHLARPAEARRSSRLVVAGVLGVLAAAVVGIAWLSVTLLGLLIP